MCGIGRLRVIGSNVSDMFFISCVYAPTRLSNVLLITCVALQTVYATGVLLVVWVLRKLFLKCVGGSESCLYVGTFKRLVILLTAGPKKVKGIHF